MARISKWPLFCRRTFPLFALALLVGAALWLPVGAAQDAPTPQPGAATQAGAGQSAAPVIHVPYFATNPDPAKGAIFWFGAVDSASNAANVRLAYAADKLVVVLHVFDRRVVYDETPAANSDLTQWDGASLYLDTQQDLAAPLGSGSYRIDAQVNAWQARTNYQRVYRRQSDAWQPVTLDYSTATGYRGTPNDQQDDRGWTLTVRIPFAALGLAGPPPAGTTWRMALALHDRDEATGSLLPSHNWPQGTVLEQPASWGRISFGAPVYSPPAVTDVQTLTIRHGVNNVTAPDAAVGGHTLCGAQFNPNFFNGWGDATYAGLAQINIQNQWDIADWPCFSRYYVTFPLAALPDAGRVVSARLTMYMFGNAGYTGADAKPSFIQAARVTADWDENSVTWNNAPHVLENIAWETVNPMQPGDPAARAVVWDVSQAVADAHAAGEPLRLALYSSDGDYHSGKYFWSADAGEQLRPMLTINWGTGSATSTPTPNPTVAPPSFALSATPIKAVVLGGETAQYEVTIAGLSPGSTVTLGVGPSSPAGLSATVSPKTIAAPGGKAVVSLAQQPDQDRTKPVIYTIPLTASTGKEVRSVELTVYVNGFVAGKGVFLPLVSR